jgi:hypothetical protein
MDNPASAGRVAMRSGAILFAAVILAWPAFYNRYPLLYPDSISYMGDGSKVARALFHREFSDYYGFRSLIYSLGIFPLHWHVTPWPIVAFNALLASYVLWLLVRSLFSERTVLHFLVIVLALSLFTGLGWLVGWVMPDLFGPLLYLSVFLLMFAGETLGVGERVALGGIAWWGIVAHASHLLIVVGLCPVLAVVLLLQGRGLRQSLLGVRPVALILLVAVASQVGLNWYLDDKPSLMGNRPPYLLARVLADGPGRWYVQKHCGDAALGSCDQLKYATDDAEEFLWGKHGWANASAEERYRWNREEMPVVLGTLRESPRQELRIAAAHFWEQLLNYGVYSYDANAWIAESIDVVLPGKSGVYQRSRQAHNKLDEDFFSSVQDWALYVSLLLIALWAIFGRRLWSPGLAGLSVLILYVVLANAAVTGNFSNVEDRYEARVIWLVPLLALAFLLTWLDRRFGKAASGEW